MTDPVDALLVMSLDLRLVIPMHTVEFTLDEISCLFRVLFATTQNVTLIAIGLDCVHWVEGTLTKLLRIGKSL